ncbi:MAG: hypothetical protein SFU99_07085, partial [Saprospiraceae bacterium]|nr:hypothetical protein [Saprospiraceae bacterium]
HLRHLHNWKRLLKLDKFPSLEGFEKLPKIEKIEKISDSRDLRYLRHLNNLEDLRYLQLLINLREKDQSFIKLQKNIIENWKLHMKGKELAQLQKIANNNLKILNNLSEDKKREMFRYF